MVRGYHCTVTENGQYNDVRNYRGITRLSTLGKLFTRLLHNRLSNWAENNSVYVEAQAGFRAGLGTVDTLFALMD
jgi:hypothetical protein